MEQRQNNAIESTINLVYCTSILVVTSICLLLFTMITIHHSHIFIFIMKIKENAFGIMKMENDQRKRSKERTKQTKNKQGKTTKSIKTQN